MQNNDFRTRLTSVCGSQTSSVVLSTHNSVLSTRIKKVPALTCEFVHANSDFSTWITSLYCSLPSSEVFACKPATFGTELHVSMGTRPHLSLCACITPAFGAELQVSMGSSPHLWFCALKTATLELKLHVSMGPRPHLWFCACKTACLASE